MTGGGLDGAKVRAELSFPGRVKQVFGEWRGGFPTTINDRDVQIVQGKLTPGGLPVKLYFDAQSGFLVRMTSYASSPVGINPTQIDYSDYRDVPESRCPLSGRRPGRTGGQSPS